MGKSKAPAPPDPRQTSAAQTGTNIGTAIANSQMGMVDQYTPYGTLKYSMKGGGDPSDIPGIQEITSQLQGSGPTHNPGESMENASGMNAGPTTSTQYQVGDQTFSDRAAAEQYRNNLANEAGGSFYSYTDPYTGQTYQIPQYESRIELNDQQQATLDENQAAQFNLGALANERSDFLRDYLPTTEAATDSIDRKLYDLGAKRLDPRFEREQDSLRTRLANQGITAGSEAWQREMDQFGQTKNDAYNQLVLNGRGQAANEVNMPINQITALLSGSQVQNPNVQMQQPASIPTTDNAGIINNNYQQQMNAWQQKNAQKQSLMGGLFGLGAAGIGAF